MKRKYQALANRPKTEHQYRQHSLAEADWTAERDTGLMRGEQKQYESGSSTRPRTRIKSQGERKGNVTIAVLWQAAIWKEYTFILLLKRTFTDKASKENCSPRSAVKATTKESATRSNPEASGRTDCGRGKQRQRQRQHVQPLRGHGTPQQTSLP